MPPSKLVSDIRYGYVGFHTLNLATREVRGGIDFRFADHFIDSPLAVRIGYRRNTEIFVHSFLDTRPHILPFDDFDTVQDGRPDFAEW